MVENLCKVLDFRPTIKAARCGGGGLKGVEKAALAGRQRGTGVGVLIAATVPIADFG